MYIPFYLALAALYLPATNSMTTASDFCQQEQTWKANVCLFMNNGIRNSNRLLSALKDVKDLKHQAADHIFNLRDSENLNCVADLYQELTAYVDIFHTFNSYFATHKQTGAIKIVNRKTARYLKRLSIVFVELNQTTDLLKTVNRGLNQTRENRTYVDVGCLKEPQTTYICSYYVAERLNILLKQLVNDCSACLPSRKGNSSGKKGGKGKKNKGSKKGNKKGGKGEKGKGKEKLRKKLNSKRNKAHETTL